MFTPAGQPAAKLDRIMLLNMWAKYINECTSQDGTQIIFAGMGKPTYPLNQKTQQFLREYWSQHDGSAIAYGHPQGDTGARKKMAEAMEKWYQTGINEENILFTVGGAGALRSIFLSLHSLDEKKSNFRVLTPYPYYTLYSDSNFTLHPIDVMQNPGYKLTAESLKLSIEEANKLASSDRKYPRALLFCDPNNPLGTVISHDEIEKIAEVLREHDELYIVLDEAYAEMVLDRKHESLLTIAPDLKKRIILMRSATKGLSAAGERMAVAMAFDDLIMSKLVENNISQCGHAPISLQHAYAETMLQFDESQKSEIVDFYEPKVSYVHNRLQKMGVNLPSNERRPDGTFYVIGDFSELLGSKLSPSTNAALGSKNIITTDEDICYQILFEDSIMIAPLSYFGLSPKKGYMRITCSESEEVLCQLMDRLESRLIQVRKEKQNTLIDNIEEMLPNLETCDPKQYEYITKLIKDSKEKPSEDAITLQTQNKTLKSVLIKVKLTLDQTNQEKKAAVTIQSIYRSHLARKQRREIEKGLNEKWFDFLDENFPENTKTRRALEETNYNERVYYQCPNWKKKYLQVEENKVSPSFMMRILSSKTTKIVGLILFIAGLCMLAAATFGVGALAAIGITGTAAWVGSSLTTAAGAAALATNHHLSKTKNNRP